MIPFFDLAAQQAVVKRQIDENISKVLAHGKYILGPEVAELEERLCEYTGAKYCITCANGTDALQIALMAIGVGPGDEVIMPAFSYIAAAEAVMLLGAKPVYVDIDDNDFNIDTNLIEYKITCKTKAIIPVSLYGRPADFDKINRIADQSNIPVIEDAAQSFGAVYKGRKSGNLSSIACTSFFPTKPLGCYGDGGAVLTSDEEVAKRVRQIARHGQKTRYHHAILGVNSRLDTLQAAILLCKLDLLDREILERQHLSKIYNECLEDVEHLITPAEDSVDYHNAWAQYTLRTKDRTRFIEHLKNFNIPHAVHYPLPLNLQPAVADTKRKFQLSERIAQEVISLPLFYLKSETQKYIIDTIKYSYN
ncbi:DegT/DnrJ/EryC1/StrS family aminotransferase [Planktomarina temperata]|nr:DegT/DnrJ/EryC1/StrS family aminotransferase [Planktomarina temperata]